MNGKQFSPYIHIRRIMQRRCEGGVGKTLYLLLNASWSTDQELPQDTILYLFSINLFFHAQVSWPMHSHIHPPGYPHSGKNRNSFSIGRFHEVHRGGSLPTLVIGLAPCRRRRLSTLFKPHSSVGLCCSPPFLPPHCQICGILLNISKLLTPCHL